MEQINSPPPPNTHPPSPTTPPPGQNGRPFADDNYRCISVNETFFISIKISLKFVPNDPFNKKRFGLYNGLAPTRPLSKPMMVKLLTHISATRSQWVNGRIYFVQQINNCWVYCSGTLSSLSSHCNWFEGRVPVDSILRAPDLQMNCDDLS